MGGSFGGMDGVGMGGFGGRDMASMGRMGGKKKKNFFFFFFSSSPSHTHTHPFTSQWLCLSRSVPLLNYVQLSTNVCVRYVQVWCGDDGS